MNYYLEKMRSYAGSFFAAPKNVVDTTEVGLMDVYIEKVLEILHWKSREQTLKVFFILNTLFWVVLMLNLKFYGVISLLALLAFIFDLSWREVLLKEYKGEYVSVVKDIKNICNGVVDILYMWRKNSPVVFYPLMCIIFLSINVISKWGSGEFVFYLVFLTIFFLPCGFNLLPEPVILKAAELYRYLRTPKCMLAEDELIPFIQGKDFNRRDADLESLLTDRTADSVTNSLASGISTMPSYLEVAEAPNEIQEEDLIPRTSKGISLTPGELSSDSDSDNKEIKFDSDHFNSSSSDEDRYSKGLTFSSSVPVTTGGSEGFGMFRSMINTVGSNIVANMFQSAIDTRPRPTRKTSSESDSSDFEIVDASELADDMGKSN